MEIKSFEKHREVKSVHEHYDLVVVGGGLTGVCCAITAARAGIRVGIIQDRPVLGGNASSEVRLWGLGATSHMGNNNRWAREGGVINEILVENTYRNKEGNPVLFDMVLMDKVLNEPNITLHLNTVVYDLQKISSSHIQLVKAFNPSSETAYEITGTLFADCSGDGLIAYLAGVSYRMGAEDKLEFSEGFAPDKKVYGELLGHSIFFYMKDTGRPVSFVAPDLALKEVEELIPKINNNEYFSIHHHGCKYWWLEYGGRLDTIHDTETIKNELWKVVYGIWGYIKNSGKFPEMETYTLEWVGLIPGKRESRRFKGMYMLTQQDIIEQHEHYDAVAFGGWSIDLHPSDGVYASGRACNQWHSKGIYQIPYRCYVGDEIDNLMFGGRIISATHVANGSTRVMCTSAYGGQVIGMAAALCIKNQLMPIDYVDKVKVKDLQRALIATGQFIPNLEVEDVENLLRKVVLEVSSCLSLKELQRNGKFQHLNFSVAQLIPIKGKIPQFSIEVLADEATQLRVELRKSSKKGNYTPDVILEKQSVDLQQGKQTVTIQLDTELASTEYVFICFMQNERVQLAESDTLLTGVTTVYNQVNIAVSNYGRQDPPEGIGVESFEFWCPKRRPEGKNLALSFSSPIQLYSVEALRNAYYRPFNGTNAWMADFNDTDPQLKLTWESEQKLSVLTFFLDVDYDHPMETVQYGHYDSVMPQCVSAIDVYSHGVLVAHKEEIHEGIVTFNFNPDLITDALVVKVKAGSPHTTPSLLGIYCC